MSTITSRGVTRFRHEAADLRAMDALNEVDFIPLRFEPVLRGAFELKIDGLKGQAVNLWMTSSSSGYHSKPSQTLDTLTVRIALDGKMIRRDSRTEYVGQVGEALLLPYRDMRDFDASAGFSAINLSVPQTSLDRCWTSLRGDSATEPVHFEPTAKISTPALVSFSYMLQRLWQRLDETGATFDIALPLLEEMLVCQLLVAWPQRQPIEAAPAEKPRTAVRRAMDYIDARLGEPITVGEVAHSVDLGIRSLQISFRREIDRTPLQYILEQRLDRAHKDLLLGDLSVPVMQIARRWGFVHPSDFARRYRLRYGRSPSQTQRRDPG